MNIQVRNILLGHIAACNFPPLQAERPTRVKNVSTHSHPPPSAGLSFSWPKAAPSQKTRRYSRLCAHLGLQILGQLKLPPAILLSFSFLAILS